MDPEGMPTLLETPGGDKPIIENSEELMRLRDEVRKIDYSKVVQKETKKPLPQNVRELREGLDSIARNMADRDETEEKHRQNVPDIVLRDEKYEKELEKAGWNKETRDEAKKLLMERLRMADTQDNKNRVENILHILIGAGKTPDEVLPKLTQGNYDQFLAQNPQIAEITQTKLAQNERISISLDNAERYAYLMNGLGLEEDDPHHMNDIYVRRFALDEGFKDALDAEFDTQLPQNLFDLAWNIQYHEHHWALHGDFPILQMQTKWVDVKGKDGKPEIDPKTGKTKQKLEGRYVVNQANFLRWLRERMYTRYDYFETDEVPDYYSSVAVHKGQYATVNLSTMIFDRDRYFTDETGYLWEGLFNQVFIEPFDVQFERQYAIEYDKASSDGEELAKAYRSWSHLSKFTRKINGKSMLDRALTLPLDYTGKDSDTRVGEAILTMYLVYYNLVDFDKLQEYLGPESEFFTREGWIKAAKEFAGGGTAGLGGIGATGMPFPENFFGSREDDFAKAFDKDGKVTEASKKAFMRFINPYYQENPPQTIVKVLAQIIQNSVQQKFKSKEAGEHSHSGGIDKDSLKYAWLKAWSWFYFSGGQAKNNWPYPSGDPAGYLEETKYLYTDGYRMKYETYGGAGNPYTYPMFKQLTVPFFEGMLVENANDVYTSYKADGTSELKKRQLTPMEVMVQLREEDRKYEVRRKELERALEHTTDESQRTDLLRQIDRLDDVARNHHKLLASNLEFNDNAMRVYSKNLIGRAKTLYDTIMKAQETEFDKFITNDGLFRGPSFNRAAWQAALQDKLFTPLRYLFEANGATQLNMKIRAPVYMGRDGDEKPVWEWRDQYLGERMLGHQILDIPTFRRKMSEISSEEWIDMKKQGYRKRGKYLVDPHGHYVIDYNKVQDNKPMVYKQWMLMKFAGDLYSHITNHSTDPAYTLQHYDNIIEAIKNLPGNIVGDEYDMKGVKITKPLFSKEQIKWLKRLSGADQLFFKEFVKAVVMGDPRKKESLFGQSTQIILGAIFKGY